LEREVEQRHRPRYHFLPAANWMNDPNGLIQWRGQYHMFYQYNPHGPFHGTIHWGHAVSSDLVHWEHLPVALAPTPGGPDEGGCWSGVAVDDDGVPTMIYSGHRNRVERACLATSGDGLLTWDKYPGNPIIPEPPDLDLVAYRDHSVWREDGMWYQLMGAGIVGAGGAALMYRSPDLRRWEYLGPLLAGDLRQREPLWTGTMWECPAFFPLGDRHVLLISVWDQGQLHYTAYFLGTCAGQRFTPEHLAMLDYGDRLYYAPQTLLDDQGRRIIFGWIPEARSNEAQMRAGWSGVMSLPRVLSLDAAGRLHIAPVAELQSARGARHHLEEMRLTAEGVAPDARGEALEILAEIDLGDAAEVVLKVRCSPDGAEETIIRYDRAAARLSLNRERASLDDTTERTEQGGRLDLAPGEPLRLQVFLDHSVLEVFANNRATLTSRIYPTRDDSLGLALAAGGGTAMLRALDIWEMPSIWEA
jgi:beta-fructofuranosidase